MHSASATRDALFGGNGARAERLPGAGTGLHGRAGALTTAIEEENASMLDELERKVSVLRGATQGIHDEVSSQNRMLSGMVRVGFVARGGGLALQPLQYMHPLLTRHPPPP